MIRSILPPDVYPAALPLPVLFHPLKHHWAYIREFVAAAPPDEATIKATLRTIGNSNPDIYAGKLPVEQIAQEVILYLQQCNALAPDQYKRLLAAQQTDYGLVTLSDGTKWVLRWGIVANRYVHIHPARYVAHTFRTKATVLKTAVAAAIEARQTNSSINLPLINRVRAQWLHLPPVASLVPGQGVAKLIDMLTRV